MFEIKKVEVSTNFYSISSLQQSDQLQQPTIRLRQMFQTRQELPRQLLQFRMRHQQSKQHSILMRLFSLFRCVNKAEVAGVAFKNDNETKIKDEEWWIVSNQSLAL